MTDGGPVCLIPSTYPPVAGGVATSARRLAEFLAGAGYRVHVITPAPQLDVGASVADEDGIRVHRIGGDPFSTGDWTGLSLRRYTRELDREIGFRMFHGFYLSVAQACASAANQPGRPRRPYVLSVRGNDAITLMDHPGLRGMILTALAKATWVTCVNRTYLDRLLSEVDLIGRCSVIYNGFEPLVLGPARPRPTSGLVGTVGEFRPVKDVPLLIRAYAALPIELRRGLRLIGYFASQEEEVWSNMLIDEFGLAGETRLTGRFTRDALPGHLSELGVYVQSSSFEGLPNALLEAASVGIPLVATAVGGMAEIIEDGRTGLLVPYGDPRALSAAIQRVIEYPALAGELAAGAARLAGQFSAIVERAAWLELYDRLLASP
ncbi:MAG TPA: glycosyltransferase [Gemmataceae bacterium]|jgi:glycosyltransferase involved in cell wall biosynthesis|nr:glycosyltransferase [Gemmataceae bacterium]